MLHQNDFNLYARIGKRTLDLCLTFCALPLIIPAVILLSLLIRVNLGRPVFFKQPRPAKEGKPFNLIKFRTMTDDRDHDGSLLPDAKRLTRLGNFLRNTSLDELPTFFNVIKGDMSIVGPRPLLVRYLERYTPEQRRRHLVKPGVTGWAQINGRNALDWESKFQHDIWYVDNLSLGLDLKIILLTLIKVFRRENISPADQPTMDEFMGTQGGAKA